MKHITHPFFWKSILITSTLLTGCLTAPAQAKTSAVQTLANLTEAENAIPAVTSGSQLSTVKPTDWAFQALQSVVKRYDCAPDYASKALQGDRAINRYEFAAILNSCMDGMNDLIASASADSIRKEDLASVRKLQEQFSAELDTLRGRLLNLGPRRTSGV